MPFLGELTLAGGGGGEGEGEAGESVVGLLRFFLRSTRVKPPSLLAAAPSHSISEPDSKGVMVPAEEREETESRECDRDGVGIGVSDLFDGGGGGNMEDSSFLRKPGSDKAKWERMSSHCLFMRACPDDAISAW